jgi:hypothetical protein
MGMQRPFLQLMDVSPSGAPIGFIPDRRWYLSIETDDNYVVCRIYQFRDEAEEGLKLITEKLMKGWSVNRTKRWIDGYQHQIGPQCETYEVAPRHYRPKNRRR